MSTEATPFVQQIEKLPTFPFTLQKILSAAASPDSSANNLAAVISADPAIAAKLLRLANSPFYGSRGKISQVSRAVVLLGRRAIYNMILAMSVRDALVPKKDIRPDQLAVWRHSVATAAACELIAQRIGLKPAEEVFVAGLLHDVGQLVMVNTDPNSFRAVFDARAEQIRFLALEKRYFGLDHCEAGYRILSRWGLPESLCQVARSHHNETISEADPNSRLLAAVVIADHMSQLMGFGIDISAGKSSRVVQAARLFGLDEGDQARILERFDQRLLESMDMLNSADETDLPDHGPSARAPGGRAIWLSAAVEQHRGIGQLLTEQCGYTLERARFSELPESIGPETIIVVEPPPGAATAAAELAARLSGQGHCVVLLTDTARGSARRWRDPETGVFCVPSVFTKHDLQWIEDELTLCPAK